MDSLTHAVSGATVMLALPRRPATAWAVPTAMIAAGLPDIDVLLPRTPADFLILHRGITHALAALPLEALFCALFMYPLWRRGTRDAWSFSRCFLFALLLLCIHVWLDCTTTYGTQAFLPFTDYRVRLNGLFIVDIWLLLPMLAACTIFRRQRRFAALIVIWIMVYSAGAVAWRVHLQNGQDAALRAQGIVPEELTVLPDAFSPLYWKVQYGHGTKAFQAPLNWDGERIGPVEEHERADPALLARLARDDRSAHIWIDFSLLPLMEELPWDNGREYRFYDWRFASLVPFAQKIQNMRSEGATPFLFSARFDAQDKLVAIRYRGSAGGGDTGWEPPVPYKGRSGWHKWVGLDDY